MTHALDPDAADALREAGVDEAEALSALARHHAAGLECVEFARCSAEPRRFDTARPETFAHVVTLHARTLLRPDGSLHAVRWSTEGGARGGAMRRGAAPAGPGAPDAAT